MAQHPQVFHSKLNVKGFGFCKNHRIWTHSTCTGYSGTAITSNVCHIESENFQLRVRFDFALKSLRGWEQIVPTVQ